VLNKGLLIYAACFVDLTIYFCFRNSKRNVLKIVLIIVNINKDENKSLISNQFTLKNDL
jgi:hypothetical protein